MSLPTIREFTPEDIPQIMELQRGYHEAYPHATVIPGEVYLSPGFDSGRNIPCAFDDEDNLLGYAPLLPVLAQEPGAPHTAWVEVKTDPSLGPWPLAKKFLFEHLVRRAREVAQGRAMRLTFQYHPSERAAIDYVCSRGAMCSEVLYRMMRELNAELPAQPRPEGLEIRRWKMATEAEQEAYVRARNECFPENPVSLPDWRSFLRSPAWSEGVSVTAFEGAEIVGSVAAFPDEGISEMSGCKAAQTEFIFVRAAWRGRGVAAYLVAEALRYLKEIGREVAFLEVAASNEAAVRLYKRLGYEVVDETRLYTLEL